MHCVCWREICGASLGPPVGLSGSLSDQPRTEDSVVMVVLPTSWGQNIKCGSQTPDPNPTGSSGLDVQPLTSHLHVH